MKEKWKPAWCGFIVGSTMIVPGVSGGSMAMILGIYDSLISAISSFRKKPKENFFFLFIFSVCAGIGMFFFSIPISWLLEHYQEPTMYFFVGAVLGGVPMIAKKAGVEKVSLGVVGYMLLGAISVLIISEIPTGNFEAVADRGAGDIVFLLGVGFISASALILPGISISHFLLVIGVYDRLVEGFRNLDIAFFIPLGAGLVVGILLITRFLEYLLNHYPRASYLTILGFVLGSVIEILPGIPMGGMLLASVLMMVSGFVAIYTLSR